MNEIGHWTYSGEEIDIAKMVGFVYIIERISPTPKFYIGKKIMNFALKRKPLKGRTNKRRYTKISDWKTYTGSSVDLNEDIKIMEKKNFTFKIIKFCESKLELSYLETKLIIESDAIFSDKYYNKWIYVRLKGNKK